jgi:Transposase IS116/IS110/IS902 family
MIRNANLTQPYELLQTIPGIRSQNAATILAESGPDMKQFPTTANFSSWSGVAPGNNESAGKRKRAPAMKGNPHIKTALVEAAWSASRTRHSEFEGRYHRIKPRIGHKRAIVASAHQLAIRIYEVLRDGEPYRQPDDSLTPREVKRLVRHHTRRLNCLHHWLAEKQSSQPVQLFSEQHRCTQIKTLEEPEIDFNGGADVHCCAAFHARLELPLLNGFDGLFVETHA